MRWKKTLVLFALFTALLIPLCLPLSSHAQDYSFSLDQEVVDTWINQDGSVTLEYWFTFTCDRDAHAIDVVDIDLPTDDYELSDTRADVGGQQVPFIEESRYVTHGIAVWLGSAEIGPGKTGTVHLAVDRVGGMVYEDSEDDECASIQFSPTQFESRVVHGSTDLTVRFHLPPDVQPEEFRRYHSPSGWPQEQPDTGLDGEGRVLYTWHNSAAASDRQYIFGISFPRRYVAGANIQKSPSVLGKVKVRLFEIAAGVIVFFAWRKFVCRCDGQVLLGRRCDGLQPRDCHQQQDRSGETGVP